jgi:hypothetical protein
LKGPARGTRRRWIFIAALVGHLTALYWPRTVTAGEGLPLDKPVHAVLFGAVLWTGTRAGLSLPWTAAALAGHAVVSEVVQQDLMAHRTGDPQDLLADLVGLALAARCPGRRPLPDPDLDPSGEPDPTGGTDPAGEQGQSSLEADDRSSERG